jgi:hypothetical protein
MNVPENGLQSRKKNLFRADLLAGFRFLGGLLVPTVKKSWGTASKENTSDTRTR